MKLVTFEREGRPCAGWIDGDGIVLCAEGPEALDAVRSAIESGEGCARWSAMAATAPRVPLAAVRLLPPMPRPVRDIFCVGKNYRAHAAEFHGSGFDSTGAAAVPEHPVIFTKATTSVIGPGAAIRASLDPTATVDYEGELGVVIGRRTFGATRETAMQAVFGYVALNDVTSRELQRRHNQWVIGKGLDSFCPLGPWIATADEIPDPTALRLVTRVNGETRQDASVADLIFDIPTLIATLSAYVTLLPGDIIATGTPEGVGIGFKPPVYLREGDVVAVEIDGLGVLENPVV